MQAFNSLDTHNYERDQIVIIRRHHTVLWHSLEIFIFFSLSLSVFTSEWNVMCKENHQQSAQFQH